MVFAEADGALEGCADAGVRDYLGVGGAFFSGIMRIGDFVVKATAGEFASCVRGDFERSDEDCIGGDVIVIWFCV